MKAVSAENAWAFLAGCRALGLSNLLGNNSLRFVISKTPVLVSVLTRKNWSCQFQVLAEGAVGTRTNFLRQHHRLGTTPSGGRWPRRKAVEFRKGRGSLLAQRKRRANRRVAVAVRPEINVQFSGPVIADGIRVGCRNFSGEGFTRAPSRNQTTS